MIETIDEFKYLRDWTIKLKREASNDSYVKIGMMLETKKALENISDFKDIDFMSIGTNDLTSELYHLNRNEILNYNAYIDSLIEKLKAVVCHCQTYNIELSICGELAGVPEVFKPHFYRVLFLVGSEVEMPASNGQQRKQGSRRSPAKRVRWEEETQRNE